MNLLKVPFVSFSIPVPNSYHHYNEYGYDNNCYPAHHADQDPRVFVRSWCFCCARGYLDYYRQNNENYNKHNTRAPIKFTLNLTNQSIICSVMLGRSQVAPGEFMTNSVSKRSWDSRTGTSMSCISP